MRADAVRNRARIMAATEAAIADHGEIVATDEVAQRAGLGIATVFRHFPNKRALLEATLQWNLENLTDKARELATENDENAVGILFRELVRGNRVRELLVAEVTRYGPLAEEPSAACERLNQQIDVVLAVARERGVLRDRVDRDLMLHLARGLSLNHHEPAASAAFELVVDALHRPGP